ncbi:MAG: HlyD family efflux transporter periplasmic adaptor subunit [Candidatus Kapabacteria bacterium]|nr:HlyD family efflux transporter periplasmic adaptor subunit [Candidatus Kapabacteria bacterium]
MSEFDGLHERQYTDLYQQDDAPLSNVRKSGLRFLLYASLIVFSGMIAAGIIIKVPRQVNVQFVLKGNSQETVLRFAESVFVEKLYVKPGQIIEKDSPIVRISSPEAAGLINDYSVALTNLQLYEKSETPLHTTQKTSLNLQKQKYTAQIADALKEKDFKVRSRKSELKKLEQTLDVATKTVDDIKKLHKKSYAADAELREAELKRTNAQDALNRAKDLYTKEIYSLENKIKQLEYDRSLANEDATKIDIESTVKHSDLQNQVHSALSKLNNLYGQFTIDNGSLVIKAPAKLLVSYVNDADKQIKGGSVLVKLMAGSSAMYASASVEPQHIGNLKSGMEAILKVSSFPHYNWGVVHGKVNNVAITPDDKGNYPFEVQITNAGQLDKQLQIGMNGELSVLVDEKTIFGYIFEKFSKVIK